MGTFSNVAVTGQPALVSIVIPSCGMREYTKLCVPSELQHSRAPFELIFLDIGALDGTGEHLEWLQAERLGGFCLLTRRAVLERVGSGLNAWTDLSLFDTDILSAKARQEGFTPVCCRDLFVHHFGTRTFAHGAPTGGGSNEHVR
jgi:hypothetical protein